MPENPFFPKKNSKIGHISQEFLSVFEKIFKILIFLEELYKYREIPDELYYLVETFIKNGLDGVQLEMQKHRQVFFGGLSGHLKAITRPPQGVRGQRPPDGSEVSFFKTIQSIRK